MRVFVDYDGTMTDHDTFDALVNEFAGAPAWRELSAQLRSQTLTLRQALEAQASLLRCTFEEADAYVARATAIDPHFAPFAERCAREGVPLTILSSGLGPLIERALARNGLAHVPLVANSAIADSKGWRMQFVDESENGHDKAAAVRAAHEAGEYVVFIGDGISDFTAALEANRVFAKAGRSLERYLRKLAREFTTFESFAEIETALFG